jgi:VIT1/CCC1 family predicted Fe2+/Mn2+ transporter
MNSARTEKLIAALKANWQSEMEGYHTYKALAEKEPDPQRRNVFRGLAAAEMHHASLWEGRLKALGIAGISYIAKSNVTPAEERDYLPLRRLEIEEGRDIAKYGKQLTDLGDQPSVAILHEVMEDEREHYRVLSDLVRSTGPLPELTPVEAQKALDSLLAGGEKERHEAPGWVGDAIYGINDGLGSIFGIVSGVSGATLGNSHFVLIAGLAGMIASALSMGSGAYLAAQSEREIFDAGFKRQRDTVEFNEPEAREVLALSYQMKGLPAEDAKRFVEDLAGNKEQFVQALARERLDTTEKGLRKPWVSAVSGALSTAIGASVPVIPFFFLAGAPAVIVAATVSLVAHFAVGAAKSLVTIRSWWSSGCEMTLIGAVEGVVTYVIGIGLGRMGGGQ